MRQTNKVLQYLHRRKGHEEEGANTGGCETPNQLNADQCLFASRPNVDGNFAMNTTQVSPKKKAHYPELQIRNWRTSQTKLLNKHNQRPGVYIWEAAQIKWGQRDRSSVQSLRRKNPEEL